MKVYVVMGNDFPETIFGTEKGAAEFVAEKKQREDVEAKSRYRSRPMIYWRFYEFELQK
jgi:hypothetical protein